MTPYDMIRTHLSTVIPFATHVGVELGEIGDGHAVATLAQRTETSNHIGTQHAGAMFTLGEAASGAALAGALAPVILEVRPVASGARLSYVKIARGTLTATAHTDRPGAALQQELAEIGKIAFDVTVDIRDAEGDTVAEMQVGWHVKRA